MRTAIAAVVCCLLVVLAGCGGIVDSTLSPTAEPSAVSTPGVTAANGSELDERGRSGSPSTTPATGQSVSTPTVTAGTAGGGSDGEANGSDGMLAVHVIAVGQSSATLVVGPSGETLLYDSGDYADDGEYVLAYLERLGIERIDYLVTSHADADHIGGHAAIIEHYETRKGGIGAVYDPGIVASTRVYEEYLDAIDAHDVPLYETRAGDGLPFAGVDVDVLGPPDPYLADRNRNENSLVLRLAVGNASVLLTGDAEAEAERFLVDRYGETLRSTVLAVGHHGSSSSTHTYLLDAVEPSVAVVSSAYDSPYGHPHEETLERLGERGVPTYWTATHGTVVFESNGESVTVATQRVAPTAPLSLREGTPIEPGTDDPVEPRQSFAATGSAGDPRVNAGPQGDASAGGATANGTDAAGTTATAVRADGGTDLRIAAINADAAGDDRTNLEDEYVVLENAGDEPIDLAGWTVSDAVDRTYRFTDGVRLGPGERVTLHTGSGTDTETDLYWGSESPIWNNDGDTVIVENANGSRVLVEDYG